MTRIGYVRTTTFTVLMIGALSLYFQFSCSMPFQRRCQADLSALIFFSSYQVF